MKAKCKHCGDTVEVTKLKKYKSCKCGAIALDYGDPPYYYRVCGNPEDFDGEVEDAPELKERAWFTDDPAERAMGIIGEENIGGESKPVGKADKFAEQAREYLNKAVKVKESFMNVNVDLCEDGTLYIDDSKEGEQLAVYKVVKGE